MNLFWVYWIGIADGVKVGLWILLALIFVGMSFLPQPPGVQAAHKRASLVTWTYLLAAILFAASFLLPGSEASSALYLRSNFNGYANMMLIQHPTAPLKHVALLLLAQNHHADESAAKQMAAAKCKASHSSDCDSL